MYKQLEPIGGYLRKMGQKIVFLYLVKIITNMIIDLFGMVGTNLPLFKIRLINDPFMKDMDMKDRVISQDIIMI
jgi:hypothetical protein